MLDVCFRLQPFYKTKTALDPLREPNPGVSAKTETFLMRQQAVQYLVPSLVPAHAERSGTASVTGGSRLAAACIKPVMSAKNGQQYLRKVHAEGHHSNPKPDRIVLAQMQTSKIMAAFPKPR